MNASPGWQLVVPVKGGTNAKSRLHPPAGVDRAALALALATDCLHACTTAVAAVDVYVVTGDPAVAELASGLGATVVADPGSGLDDAVLAGRDAAAASAADAAGPRPLAVLLGDLPALRPGDLLEGLRASGAVPRAVVPDARGTGTVLLASGDPYALVPSFGEGSAARHVAAGHHRLDLDLPRLRTDVDDDRDLQAALALGVGPATRATLEGAGYAAPMQASVHTFDDASGAGSVLLDDGRELRFPGEVFAASALRHVRPGQRVSIELDDGAGSVARLWMVGIGDGEPIR